MTVIDNIKSLQQFIPANVTLVAVSKTQPVADILMAYQAGQRVFGENKVQELTMKQAQLPADIEWHMLGHLQTNKIKYIAPFVSLIHSVDSLKLLKEINKEAIKNNRIINCLLQFYIASEETKFGLSFEEVAEILSSVAFKGMKNIRIVGVMGMASFVDDELIIRKEFSTLKNYFDELKKTYFQDEEYFKEISMGMSSDFKIAIDEGSTMVRIGTAIFGDRNYL